MTATLRFIDALFDFAFHLMRSFPPLLVLVIFSAASAVFTLLIFKWTSNQKAIRRAKYRIGAHVLEIRLFPDQLRVVARAYLALLGSLLVYFRHSLRPAVVLIVPLFVLFVQMEAYFEHTPIAPSQEFLLSVGVEDERFLNDVEILLPSGLSLTAPAVHIAADREVDWRLSAEKPGDYELRVQIDGKYYAKRIVVGSDLRRVNSERRREGIWKLLLSQGELPLPREGKVESIRVQYPERMIFFWKWELGWVLPFLVLMLAEALALKGVLRTEL
jgi:hypothetical protein